MQVEKTLEEELQACDARIAEAEETQGDIELRDALAAKAEAYLRHGNRGAFREYYLKALDKTSGVAKKLDYHMAILHSHFEDQNEVELSAQLRVCQRLNAEAGDWEHRNKLAVYEGLLALKAKDLQRAAGLFLGCVNTFNAGEVIGFETMVGYAVLLGALTLTRKEVAERIVDNAEVRTVLNDLPALRDFILALYRSRYSAYFPALLVVVDTAIRPDRYLRPIEHLLVGRARLSIYQQYLEAYRTVRLEKMAADLGVSPGFIDRELAGFIASGRLHCKIDLLAGVVESVQRDTRLTLTAQILAKGEALAERLAQLAIVAQQ